MAATPTHRSALVTGVLLLMAAVLTPGTSASATSQDDARVVAPTGRIVATAFGPGYVVSMLPDGSDRQRVVKFPDGAFVGGIDVTSDGSKIAMTFGPGNRGHIYTVNSDGSDFKQVSRGGDDSGPTFSRTGARIAFTRYGNPRSTLIRAKADGTDVAVLTSGAEPQPDFTSWSPDGRHIAFIDLSGRNSQSIVVTDTNGIWFRFVHTIPRKKGQLFTLDWSPDSSKIIYARYSPDYSNADLWTIDADGTNLTRITDTPDRIEVSPAYSPDGSAIACSVAPSNDEGQTDVLVMDADGGNRQRIDTPKIEENHVAWGG